MDTFQSQKIFDFIWKIFCWGIAIVGIILDNSLSLFLIFLAIGLYYFFALHIPHFEKKIE